MVLLRALVGASISLSLWFVVSLGDPRRTANPPVAWLLAAWGWITIAFELLLLLALLRIHVPPWLAVGVLAAQDTVFAWRLVLLRRSRTVDREGIP
jgi:hypothetical protein